MTAPAAPTLKESSVSMRPMPWPRSCGVRLCIQAVRPSGCRLDASGAAALRSGGRAFDVMMIEVRGESQEIIFDITSFFGR